MKICHNKNTNGGIYEIIISIQLPPPPPDTGSVNRLAFTLAETLITLGIIGIIAAITIPALTVKYQKKVTALRLKQFYSQMNEAVKLSEIDNGPAKNWDTSLLDGNAIYAYLFIDKYLLPYTKVTKAITYPKKDCLWYCVYKHYYLTNGVFFSVHTDSQILFMVKTAPGPQIAGKNVFYFMYHPTRYNSKIMPYNWLPGYGYIMMDQPGDRERLITLCKGGGSYSPACAGLIMYDDWEIKDDYPIKF